ncbi:MAG: hypothetical protein LUE27_07380 [Clostridia bacterium]|nr:hypothetical protein [Clostridia bacterium]
MVFACACGSKSSTNATDKGVSVASQAIEVIDGYLDGKTSYDTAKDTLSSLSSEMDYIEDMPNETSDEMAQRTADTLIRSKLTIISGDILDDYYHGDNETYDKIVEDRNELAENAGLESR